MSDNKIYCEKCNRWFNPASYVHHTCVVTSATQLLTRHMLKIKTKKRTAVMMPDLSGPKGGVFPESNASNEDRDQALRFWCGYLHDINEQRIQKLASVLRHVNLAKRLRGRLRANWRKDVAEKYKTMIGRHKKYRDLYTTSPGGSVNGLRKP